jgi:hypothetical protein
MQARLPAILFINEQKLGYDTKEQTDIILYECYVVLFTTWIESHVRLYK